MIKSILDLLSLNVIANIILIASLPLLSEVYAPDIFGRFALLASIIAVLTPIICLRYDLAIPLGSGGQKSSELFGLSIWICAGSTLIVALLSTIVHSGNYFSDGSYSYSFIEVMLVPVIVMLAGVLSAASYFLIAQSNFQQLGRAKVLGAISLVAIQLFGSAFGVLGLLCSMFLSTIFQLFYLFKNTSFRSKVLVRLVDFHRLRDVGIKYLDYPKMSAPASLINMLCSFLPLWFITYHFGVVWAGIFAIISKLILGPFDVLNKTLYDVLYGRIVKIQCETRQGEIASSFVKFVKISVLPIFIGIILLCFPLYEYFFDEKWHDGAALLSILLLIGCSGLLVLPISGPLIQIQRAQFKSLQFQIILFLFRLIGLVVGYLSAEDIVYSLLGFALGTILAHGYLTCWVYSVIETEHKKFSQLLQYFAIVTVMCLITFADAITELSFNSWEAIVIYILFLAAYSYRFGSRISVLFRELKVA